MVAYPDAQLLDIAGPLQMFAGAAKLDPSETAPYEVEIWAREAGPLRSCSGIQLIAERSFLQIDDRHLSQIDTLLISGGDGTVAAADDPDLIALLQRAAHHCRRVASVCTGAFLLAKAGVLAGKRVTTHWRWAEQLARQYPDLEVDADALFICDGDIWTSAGVTAGMDMALAMIEADLGRESALDVARGHVLFMMRPGGQSQFSAELAAQYQAGGRLSDLVDWIVHNITSDLSVPEQARRAGMSERTLARRFMEETGWTPARFVELARLDVARRRLETDDHPVDTIAFKCGFTSGEQMRRTFLRHLNVTPQQYRSRFRSRRLAS